MASLISKKGTYKNPPWMKNVPFKKGTPGYGSQLFAVFICAIVALILIY